MATYNKDRNRFAWILIVSALVIGGYMDAQDAKLMERASVQVAQK